MSKRILWLKWIDPLSPEDDEEQPIDLEIEDEEDDEPVSTYRDSYEEMEQQHKQENGGNKGFNPGPILVGPMGVIPLNEHNQPSKVFNFWMGHTNFNLEDEEKNIIENVSGVETLEVYTRYRFRISIGRAFDEREVMTDIERQLCPAPPVQQEQIKLPESRKPSGLANFKKHLDSKYKYWAIFILPDGQMDYMHGDSKDSIKETIAKYPMKAKVLTSWEVNDAEQVSTKNSYERGISKSARK